ncbi:DUF2938 domain-containing protein [Paraglaciecola arctica]|uniref:DUF2938 domain-containing protein n=1 Tax=Paraglaciecola arctica TaxID=1128911 RepID=UPI001C07A924|nr:DUF2938 domain-containing protein [Paraglaciecola arctica]
MENLFCVILIGIGATAVMDLWAIARAQLFNIPPTNWALVGRWIAYLPGGKFHHVSIAASEAVGGEHLIGWTAHYIIGVAYAALLVVIFGETWIQHPSIIPALVVGIATVVAPFFIMQPGMGAGIAASRTPKPNAVRLQSILNHGIFGFGMYLSACAVKFAYSL